MTHAVETMAWTGETPWHGLGNQVSNDLTPEQMLVAAQLDWTVSKRPVFWQPNGQPIEIKDKHLLVRDSDNQPLSMVGATYKPVQNAEAMSFFKKFVDAGHMQMETAGSLWGGRYIWALARVTDNFKVGKDDEVIPYVCLMSPHVLGKALIAQFTPVRVVCWNTLSMALGAGLKGNKNAFRMPHSTKFDDRVKAQAEEALGIAVEQTKLFKEASILLSKKKISEQESEEYFCEVLRFDPKDAEKAKAKAIKRGKNPDEVDEEREPRALPKLRQALLAAPGQDLRTAQGTLWGAFNAVTFVMDHDGGRDRDTALKNSWIGHKSQVKRRALDLALQRAK